MIHLRKPIKRRGTVLTPCTHAQCHECPPMYSFVGYLNVPVFCSLFKTMEHFTY